MTPRGDRLDIILDQMLDNWTRGGPLVGAELIVRHRGTLLYHKATGLRDRENGQPVVENTVFRLASLTKAITSVAAMALIDRGLFGLDDLVSKFLPEFLPRLASGEVPPITIRQLLTHTAGLTYSFLQPDDSPYRRARISDGVDEPGVSMSEQMRRIASVPLIYTPGTSWGYSVGLDVIGAVIERVTGGSLEEAVATSVTKPLGMSDTSFAPPDRNRLVAQYMDGHPTPSRMGDHQVIPFGEGTVHFVPDRAWTPGSFNSGGAGLFGTAADYARFLEAVRTRDSKILSAKSAEAVFTNGTNDFLIGFLGPGWGFGIGGAVLVEPAVAGSPQSAGTWHWSGGYGHHCFVDPTRELTMILMTNTSFAGMVGLIPDTIRDVIYSQIGTTD